MNEVNIPIKVWYYIKESSNNLKTQLCYVCSFKPLSEGDGNCDKILSGLYLFDLFAFPTGRYFFLDYWANSNCAIT